MPERTLKPVFAFLVPAGIKIAPVLTFEFLASWVIATVAGIDAITISLLAVQFLAGVSNLITHGFRSGESRKAAIQVAHMWVILGLLRAVAHAKLLPVDPYPFSASIFIAVEALLILKNASDSGLNTPWLDRIFESLKAKADPARPGPRTDSQSVADWERLQADVKKDGPHA